MDGSRRTDTPPGFKPPWVVVCALPGVEADEVPPGTQVWYDAPDSEDDQQ